MKFLTKQLTLDGYRYCTTCEEIKVIILFEEVVRIVIKIKKFRYLVETVNYNYSFLPNRRVARNKHGGENIYASYSNKRKNKMN